MSSMVMLGIPNRLFSNKQLKRLNDHVYKAENNSILDPIFQLYWNSVARMLPIWLAPNLITLIGLMVNVSTTILLLCFSMDGKVEAPRSAYILCSMGLFIYQTLDAIDGKQARRTGTSSPLGELFDHGCDSISSVFVMLSICVAIKLGEYPLFMYIFFFVGITAFYCSHWQTYVSGTFRFGVVDITEAQISIIIAHLISGCFGTDLWAIKILPIQYGELRLVLCCIGIVACSWMIYNVFSIIVAGGVGKNGSTVAGTSVLSPAIPLLAIMIFGYIISQKSMMNILEQSPVLFVTTFGIMAAHVTNKLVVAHMMKGEIEFFDRSIIGILALFLNQYFNYVVSEYYVLWFALIFASYSLLTYSTAVCLEICQHLKIRLFIISPFNNDSKLSRNHSNSRELSPSQIKEIKNSNSHQNGGNKRSKLRR